MGKKFEGLLAMLSLVIMAYIVICWLQCGVHYMDALNGSSYEYPDWNIFWLLVKGNM